MSLSQKEKIAEYYDSYATQQVKIGVNIRHRTIIKNLLKAGLKKDMRVLEIGCGIGTLTGLLAKVCKSLHAVDISAESIAIAKQRLKHHENITFGVTDMQTNTPVGEFDFIVLPDVLEHIPIEQHPALFTSMASLLATTGKICIHIPDPYALEYIRKHKAELLQIIDQPLYSDLLVPNIYAANLTLHKLERYQLQATLPDYQWIEIIHRPTYSHFDNKPYQHRVMDELKSRF
jgi:cyclopropane fatty-acyl-phospholipid synthase-like methyltransferase